MSLPYGPARHRPASHRSRCQTQPVHPGHAGSGRRGSSGLPGIFRNPENSWPAWDHSSSPCEARKSRACRLHAKLGKAERVVEYLQKLGGADEGALSLEVPEDEVDTYLGRYEVKGAGTHQLVMERSRRGGFGVARGEIPIRLHRTGDHIFSPSGSPHVTVRFGVVDNRAVGLTVHGSKPILSATRVGD